jgi:hypothetical protein
MKRIASRLFVGFSFILIILIPLNPPVSAQLNRKTILDTNYAIPNITAIEGTVRDANGDPISGITVTTGDFSTLFSCASTALTTDTTDTSGNYTLNVSPGNYMVYINSHNNAQGYLPEAYPDVHSWEDISDATMLTVAADELVINIDFNLSSGYKISGRLVDGSSQPILGAGGTLEDTVQEIEYTCALGGGSSPTDGIFKYNVPAGLYTLNFCKGVECHMIFKGKIIKADTSLGDVLFADASNPPDAYNPQAVMPGYTIEHVVSGGQNCPSDVAVTPNGHIYLAAVRSWHVYEILGSTLSAVSNTGVYSLAAGSDNNLYGYFFPNYSDQVYKIVPGGSTLPVGTLPQTSCESTLAVAPDLTLWIGHNACGGTSMGVHTIYQMDQFGVSQAITTVPGYITALDFDSGGNLFMTSGNKLYQVNTSTGDQSLLTTLPEPASFHGLVAGQGGYKYVATSWNDADHTVDTIYRVDMSNNYEPLVSLPAGCLNGLDQEPSGDLLATMRCTGALYRVHLDKTWVTVLEGNGISTPDILAINQAGELLVNNNESGNIVKIKNGRGEYFTSVNSFTPPYTDFAFLPLAHNFDFYYSEAAPGMLPRLIKVSKNGGISQVTRELAFPSGLAFNPNGQLFAVEYMAGKITKVTSTGGVIPFVSDLTRPQPLVADSMGNLYVGDYSGELVDPTDSAELVDTNQIWQVEPNGTVNRYLEQEFKQMAVSPTDQLFISAPVGNYHFGVLRINADQSLTPFAIGFLDPVGLAFDVAGNLYVADLENNSIDRIKGFPFGTVMGIITKSFDGAPIPGAGLNLVTGYPMVKGVFMSTFADGSFNMQVEPRQYTLIVTAPGMAPTIQDLTVAGGETIIVNLEMELGIKNYLPLLVNH